MFATPIFFRKIQFVMHYFYFYFKIYLTELAENLPGSTQRSPYLSARRSKIFMFKVPVADFFFFSV